MNLTVAVVYYFPGFVVLILLRNGFNVPSDVILFTMYSVLVHSIVKPIIYGLRVGYRTNCWTARVCHCPRFQLFPGTSSDSSG
jgi:hypothetical protein